VCCLWCFVDVGEVFWMLRFASAAPSTHPPFTPTHPLANCGRPCSFGLIDGVWCLVFVGGWVFGIGRVAFNFNKMSLLGPKSPAHPVLILILRSAPSGWRWESGKCLNGRRRGCWHGRIVPRLMGMWVVVVRVGRCRVVVLHERLVPRRRHGGHCWN